MPEKEKSMYDSGSIKIERIDTSIESREINQEVVEDYAELMKQGVKFPPVSVCFGFDPNHPFLIDGRHRLEAMKLNGQKEAEFSGVRGKKEDAQWAAVGANKSNGLRLTGNDKKRMIEIALRNFPDKSTRTIAEQIGCDQSYIVRIKKQVMTQSSPERTGIDLADMDFENVGNWGKEDAEKQTSNDSGSLPEKTQQKTPPPVVKGKDGKNYPASKPEKPPKDPSRLKPKQAAIKPADDFDDYDSSDSGDSEDHEDGCYDTPDKAIVYEYSDIEAELMQDISRDLETLTQHNDCILFVENDKLLVTDTLHRLAPILLYQFRRQSNPPAKQAATKLPPAKQAATKLPPAKQAATKLPPEKKNTDQPPAKSGKQKKPVKTSNDNNWKVWKWYEHLPHSEAEKDFLLLAEIETMGQLGDVLAGHVRIKGFSKNKIAEFAKRLEGFWEDHPEFVENS